MANADETETRIQVALVVGDTRLANMILSGLLHDALELHQVVCLDGFSSEHESIEAHITDISFDTLYMLFRRIRPDIVFSAHSPGSFDVQRQIIDAVIAAQVGRFVPGEFSQDCLNEKIQERLPPCRERFRVIQYLHSQADEGHISWAAVATGTELSHGITSGNLGFEMEWQSATVFGTGKERFAASSAAWIGKVARRIVQCWGEIQDRFLYAAEMIVSADQIVKALGDQTGSQWVTGHVGIEDAIREAERRMERGFPDASMFMMERSVLSDLTLDAVRPFLQDDAKGMLGLTGGSLRGVMERIAHEYKHNKGDCGCG